MRIVASECSAYIPPTHATYDTPGNARGVNVLDGVAYVADGSSGLHAIDVSDPSQPTLLGSYYPPYRVIGVYMLDGVAYVTVGLAVGL